MKMRVALVRPGDGVMVNRKWVIIHSVKNECSPEGRSTQLRGHFVANGKAEPVELTVPSSWEISVSKDLSGEAVLRR